MKTIKTSAITPHLRQTNSRECGVEVGVLSNSKRQQVQGLYGYMANITTKQRQLWLAGKEGKVNDNLNRK
jgi:hypothetical protein